MSYDRIVTRASLLLFEKGEPEAMLRFGLFRRDVEGANVALRSFEEIRSQGSLRAAALAAAMHHASCFACALHRAGRLLAACARDPAGFPASVAEVMRREWGANSGLFQSLAGIRHAIEHVDPDEAGAIRCRLFSLEGDLLKLDDGRSVGVTRCVLDPVRASCQAIASAIVAEFQAPGS